MKTIGIIEAMPSELKDIQSVQENVTVQGDCRLFVS